MRGLRKSVALSLALLAGCAASVPNVGGAPITCKVTTDCLAGEFCDTSVSPALCIADSDGGGTTSGTSSGTTGTSSTSGTSTSGSSGGGCVIDGGTFAANAPNPANACQLCLPQITEGAWSSAQDGIACTADGGNVCQGGACITACVIGGQIVPPGAVSAANPCTVCNPDAGVSAFTNATDLTVCAAAGGNLCVAGSCQSGCAIDGGFVPQWAFSDPLQAECCNAGISAGGWTKAFASSVGQDVGNAPTGIAVADFNGDGFSDFAVSTDTPNLEVFLSSSDGGFVNWMEQPLSGQLVAIVTADLNQDGYPDLAVLSSNAANSAVDVFYGDGGGGFDDGGSIGSLNEVQSLLVPYIVAGQAPEFLISEASGGGEVGIYQSESGGFVFEQAPAVTPSPGPMCAADFRSASTNDVAVLDTAGAGISLLLNESNGTVFRATAPFVSPPSAAALTSANLPASSLPTLAVTGDDGGSGLVQLYESLTDGGFSAGASAAVSRSPAAIVAFRRDGGNADTLATASGTLGTIDVLVAFDGGLAPSASYPAGTKANALATGDFNGDGLTDLAVSDPSSGNVYILYGQCR